MAASFASAACRILVMGVVVVATLSSYGAAAKYVGTYVCRGTCDDIPDCDYWCKTTGGYPLGGICVLPYNYNQYCCCIK